MSRQQIVKVYCGINEYVWQINWNQSYRMQCASVCIWYVCVCVCVRMCDNVADCRLKLVTDINTVHVRRVNCGPKCAKPRGKLNVSRISLTRPSHSIRSKQPISICIELTHTRCATRKPIHHFRSILCDSECEHEHHPLRVRRFCQGHSSQKDHMCAAIDCKYCSVRGDTVEQLSFEMRKFGKCQCFARVYISRQG